MLLFTLVFSLCLSLSYAGGACPDPEDATAACKCTRSEYLTEEARNITAVADQYTFLNCVDGKSFNEIEQYLLSQFKVIDKLTLQKIVSTDGSKLARLPSSWLKGIRVQIIEILDSQLSGDFLWQGNPFETQTANLNGLIVKTSSLHGTLTYDTSGTVNTKGLEKFSKVQLVDFSNNYLTTVSSTAFLRTPKNLGRIDLSENEINRVQPGAFRAVLNLRSINLANNRIESIDRSIFPIIARNLETINLGSNSLTALPVTFFSLMPSLVKVDLSKNNLHSLPERTWLRVWPTLMILDVSENSIECCGLLWLAKKNKFGRTISGLCVVELPFGASIENKLQELTRQNVIC